MNCSSNAFYGQQCLWQMQQYSALFSFTIADHTRKHATRTLDTIHSFSTEPAEAILWLNGSDVRRRLVLPFRSVLPAHIKVILN